MYNYNISQFNIDNIKKKYKNYNFSDKSFFYDYEWIEASLELRPSKENFFLVEIFDEKKIPMLFFFEIKKILYFKVLTWLFVDDLNFSSPIVFKNSTLEPEILKKTIEKIYKNLNVDLVFLDKNPYYINNLSNPLLIEDTQLTEKILIIKMKNLSWSKFYENISNNKTKQTDRRKEKKLKKFGNFEILITRKSNEKKKIMDVTLRNKILYLKQKNLNPKNFERLYLKLFDKVQYNHNYICSALKINNQIVSTIIGIIQNNKYYYLIPSYSADQHQKFSPGRLLLKEQVKWCFKNEIEVFDFGPGNFEYKKNWSNGSLYYFKIIKAITFFGLIIKKTYNLKRFLTNIL